MPVYLIAGHFCLWQKTAQPARISKAVMGKSAEQGGDEGGLWLCSVRRLGEPVELVGVVQRGESKLWAIKLQYIFSSKRKKAKERT